MKATITKETVNNMDLYIASVQHADGSGSHHPCFSMAEAEKSLDKFKEMYKKEGVLVK